MVHIGAFVGLTLVRVCNLNSGGICCAKFKRYGFFECRARPSVNLGQATLQAHEEVPLHPLLFRQRVSLTKFSKPGGAIISSRSSKISNYFFIGIFK